MSLRIDVVPNRNSTPQILLRKSWREGKRVRHKTVLNLTHLPPHLIDGIRALLQGGVVFHHIQDAVTVQRALPHGHVAAALGMARRLELPRILDRRQGRMAELALAAIICRLCQPASKLATARQLSDETATSSLTALLQLGPVSGNEMLDMLDWLHHRQRHIQTALANRHLDGGALMLYDVSSSYLEGRCCPLSAFGYNRDGKRGKQQITYGLLCNAKGCPVAIEVFDGNTADPATVASQVKRIRERFPIERVTLVGDRGMLTSARIRDDLKPVGLDWISALKNRDLRKLLAQGEPPLDPESLAADEVAEIVSPDFPGERLMVCLNPRLRAERARKREDLLSATEGVLQDIARQAQQRKPGPDNRDRTHAAIGSRVNRWKVLKHFDIEVREDGVTFSRNLPKIQDEARLDGVYAVRTSLDTEHISPAQAVSAYKSLSQVERAFRSMKTTRLAVRPVYVYNAKRVRAHVFLCMLAWYLEWHMRRRLAPLLFEDHDREAARTRRDSPVDRAEVSDSAQRKAARKRTPDGLPVHSMDTLMADLATLTLNRVTLPGQPDSCLMLTAQPTAVQAEAFHLLGIRNTEYVYSNLTPS